MTTPEPAAEETLPLGEEVPAPVETSDDEVELPRDIEAAKKLRSEAAGLRKENRELREVNERLLTQAQATARREIERAAGEVLVDPSDVWRIDPELQQSFYDEQFSEIVPDAVRAAARALAESSHI